MNHRVVALKPHHGVHKNHGNKNPKGGEKYIRLSMVFLVHLKTLPYQNGTPMHYYANYITFWQILQGERLIIYNLYIFVFCDPKNLTNLHFIGIIT